MTDEEMLGAELIIGDLLQRYPEAARVFLRHGMACVGCDMAAFETLADAATCYGLPPAPFLLELAQGLAPRRSTAA